ncbi:immunity 49 family protein [Kitasatospora sp. NPDC059088]|uniref:immunity 49 family protein n=1 Tax=Kitasatospora sp. NPDC059088 TaxID=3346722 RepID=UPI0036A23B67
MTVTVARHLEPRPDGQAFADRLSERVNQRVDGLEESSSLIDFAFSTALLALQAHCAADPEGSRLETWKAAVTAMQLGSALFAVTGASEGTVECFINDRPRAVPAAGPQSYADADHWLAAFWLALVCRERERMTQLCEIPLDRLQSPEGVYDEYVYHWIDVQQSYQLRRPGLVDKLIATIAAANPEAAVVTLPGVLDGLMYPPIHLFYLVVRGREEEFAPALGEALDLHKTYWSAEDWAAKLDGALALGPLAMACLAFDREFPVDVESPYLPKYLLSGGWLGEFST